MKVRDSLVWNTFFKGKKAHKACDGSPELPADTAEVYAQQIHDLLADKGFTFMNCFIILHIVQETLKQERDIKKL